MFLTLTFFCLVCFGIAGADVCYVKNEQLLNVTCHTNHSDINSLVWRVEKSNYSYFLPDHALTLLKCTLSGCSSESSDLPISATVNLDSTNNSIVSSNLIGPLVNVINYNVTHYANLVCETRNESYNLCEIIQIYANPDNVTCSLDNVISYEKISFDCLVYPSGRLVEFRYNNNTFPSTTHNDAIYSSCALKVPTNSRPYYTRKCDVVLDLSFLRPGNNYFSVTVSPDINVNGSPDVTDTIVTITSNTIIIHAYGSLQEPICGPPKFEHNGATLKYNCVSPLSVEPNALCTLKSRTNGTLIRSIGNDYKRRVLDRNKTIVDACFFGVYTSLLGPGQHELQGTMFIRNDKEETISVSSNWSSPMNFYPATEMYFTINGSTDGVVAKVGDQIIVNCNVNGFPPSHIKLRLGEYSLSEFDSSPSDIGTISFIEVHGCSQADVYNCSSLSSTGEQLTKTVFVNIPCQIRLRSRRHSEYNSFSLGTYINTTIVKFEVFGYPGPRTMTLSNLPKSLTTSVQIVYTQEQGPYGTIKVQFNNTKLIRDRQHIQLDVDNGVGNTSFDFDIQVNSVMSIKGSAASLCLSFVYIMSRFFV